MPYALFLQGSAAGAAYTLLPSVRLMLYMCVCLTPYALCLMPYAFLAGQAEQPEQRTHCYRAYVSRLMSHVLCLMPYDLCLMISGQSSRSCVHTATERMSHASRLMPYVLCLMPMISG